jgi:uncharacterized integral membrane protein (TIGR00698 family)
MPADDRPAAHLPIPSPVYTAVLLASLLTLVVAGSAGIALVCGIALSLVVGNPRPAATAWLARTTLTWSIVGLGAGMNLFLVARVGVHGLGYTAATISCAFLLAWILRRILDVDRDVSLLIAVGTAICGGSAIAAAGPAINARDDDMSMALVTVFLLNAAGLLLFPLIGHRLHMAPGAFGLWCALAIHDTSSVVGAAAQYGSQALEVATTAKLARALWIVPVTMALTTMYGAKIDPAIAMSRRPRRPWFIVGFAIVSALVTFVPALTKTSDVVFGLARHALVGALFLIGLSFSRDTLRSVGVRPFVQASALWIVMAALTLGAILAGWIA